MIYEASKDYGTGAITMIGDGNTPERDAWDYVRDHYGMHPGDGSLEHTPESEYCGMKNPEVWTFIRANSGDEQRRGHDNAN